MENFEHESNEERLNEGNEDLNSPQNKVVVNRKMDDLFNKAQQIQQKKWYVWEYNNITWQGTIQVWQYKLTFDRKSMEWYTKNKGSMRSNVYYDYSNIQLTEMPDDNNKIQAPTWMWEFKSMSDFLNKTRYMDNLLKSEIQKDTKETRASMELNEKLGLDDRLDRELEDMFV